MNDKKTTYRMVAVPFECHKALVEMKNRISSANYRPKIKDLVEAAIIQYVERFK